MLTGAATGMQQNRHIFRSPTAKSLQLYCRLRRKLGCSISFALCNTLHLAAGVTIVGSMNLIGNVAGAMTWGTSIEFLKTHFGLNKNNKQPAIALVSRR